jgi:hypothetical protein
MISELNFVKFSPSHEAHDLLIEHRHIPPADHVLVRSVNASRVLLIYHGMLSRKKKLGQRVTSDTRVTNWNYFEISRLTSKKS